MNDNKKSPAEWLKETANRRRTKNNNNTAQNNSTNNTPTSTTMAKPTNTTTTTALSEPEIKENPFAHLDPKNVPLGTFTSETKQSTPTTITTHPAVITAATNAATNATIPVTTSLPSAIAATSTLSVGAVPLPALHAVAPWHHSNSAHASKKVWNSHPAHPAHPRRATNALQTTSVSPFVNPAQVRPITQAHQQPQPQPQPQQIPIMFNQNVQNPLTSTHPAQHQQQSDASRLSVVKRQLLPSQQNGGIEQKGGKNVDISTDQKGEICIDQKIRTDVSRDDVMNEWKELHGVWTTATQQNRVKREREEKHQRPSITRLGGTPAGRGQSINAIEISEPPRLFDPSSMNMLFSLLMGGGSSSTGESSGAANHFFPSSSVTTTEVIRSPSGHSQQVIMMTQSSENSSERRLFDAVTSGVPRRPAARMVFNDPRLDSAAANSRPSGPINPFSSGSASTRWRDLFRVAGQGNAMTPPTATAGAGRGGGGGGGGGGGANNMMGGGIGASGMGGINALNMGGSNGESALQSLLNRTLYESQPTPSGLRNGGNTLIVLDVPPPATDAENCPICLDNDREITWSQFPCCKNFGHLDCAKRWLQTNIRCPICRTHVP